MSRLEISNPNHGKLVMEESYKSLARIIQSSSSELCPVSVARSFLEFCYLQSCGKCVPCRVGLYKLKEMIDDVINGTANEETYELMKNTAITIMNTADCSIGCETAGMIYNNLLTYKEHYMSHITDKHCNCTKEASVPCVMNCPARVDIPGYIALIREKRYDDAIRLIRKDNPFPTTCAFICEHPCEAKCRRTIMDDAVNIRGLKRFAVDYAGEVEPPKCNMPTEKEIAIIGGGPTGLSAAYYLQLMGHQTTIYEMLPELGGMLRYGIPSYRLPKDRLDEDIKAILKTGIQVKYNVKIGKDISFKELCSKYDAVLISIGASTSKKLGLDGENANGVYSAISFLRDIALGKSDNLEGKEVVVVGGGNVAMDVVRSAKRLGAKKVTLVYRRRISDMTALRSEIEETMQEGIEFMTLCAPSSLKIDEKGNIKGMYVTPQIVSNINNGRASIKPSGEKDKLINCDVLISAIGQSIETEPFEEEGIPVEKNRIKILKDASIENYPNIFAGGDCSNGPATVITTIASAKVVAANIDEFLGYRHNISCDIDIPEPIIEDKTPCARVNLSQREALDRINDWNCVENCFNKNEALQEAERCLRCDRYGFGSMKGGRQLLW